MKKIYSLKNKQQFEKVLSSKQRIFHEGIILFYQKSEEFKIGISVPKRQGNAVYRNKNKRLIKNIIGQIKPYDKIKGNIVIIAKEKFNNKTFNEKKIVLTELFNKINLN